MQLLAIWMALYIIVSDPTLSCLILHLAYIYITYLQLQGFDSSLVGKGAKVWYLRSKSFQLLTWLCWRLMILRRIYLICRKTISKISRNCCISFFMSMCHVRNTLQYEMKYGSVNLWLSQEWAMWPCLAWTNQLL